MSRTPGLLISGLWAILRRSDPPDRFAVESQCIPCQHCLFSTRRPTRDLSDYWVLSSTWQSPTAL
jgi:hypothetical protein